MPNKSVNRTAFSAAAPKAAGYRQRWVSPEEAGMSALPLDSEIVQAVETLFAATASLDRTALWNALVPTDSDLGVNLVPGHKLVTRIPTYEFHELMDFVDFFGNLLNADGQSEGDDVRVKLMLYCHIMESEFMPALVWNQLRLLSGLVPCWNFVRATPKGKVEVCEYPWQKFQEIEKLSATIRQPIGDVISRIWKRDLRNAFFHSRYFLGSAYVIPSGQLSPVSRKSSGLVSKRQAHTYSFSEVGELYRCAHTLVLTVASKHSRACKTFNP